MILATVVAVAVVALVVGAVVWQVATHDEPARLLEGLRKRQVDDVVVRYGVHDPRPPT